MESNSTIFTWLKSYNTSSSLFNYHTLRGKEPTWFRGWNQTLLEYVHTNSISYSRNPVNSTRFKTAWQLILLRYSRYGVLIGPVCFSELISCRHDGLHAERDFQLRVHVKFPLAFRATLLQNIPVRWGALDMRIGFLAHGHLNWQVGLSILMVSFCNAGYKHRH